MRHIVFSLTLTCFLCALSVPYAHAGPITLGTAGSFAVLAGTAVTNTGPSVIDGNVGVSPGSSVTGLPFGLGSGSVYAADAIAGQAQNDMLTAYNTAAGEASDANLSGKDLGGLTLTPGVYTFDSSAGLTGALTLNAEGDPNAAFIFQIGSTLTTASDASVNFSNGGLGNNVYWQVGSSATLGTNTAFAGNILALTSITLDTSASIACGSALAHNGAVTLDDNSISTCVAGGVPVSATPEPPALILFLTGLLGIVGFCTLRKARQRCGGSHGEPGKVASC